MTLIDNIKAAIEMVKSQAEMYDLILLSPTDFKRIAIEIRPYQPKEWPPDTMRFDGIEVRQSGHVPLNKVIMINKALWLDFMLTIDQLHHYENMTKKSKVF